jgi:hypothetical protein
MSSHREAPEISKDPVADSTDLYAFVSPDRPDTVTLIANYLPLQSPAGGPNFYEFGNGVLYEIHIDNDGDGRADITYQFDFTTVLQVGGTFLYNVGPITSLNSSSWNRRQFYDVTRIDWRVHGKGFGDGRGCAHTDSDGFGFGFDPKVTTLLEHVSCPPCNIGPLSTPDYVSLANAAVHNLPGGGVVFAGQRAEGFYVDLGAVFDLGDLRPFEQLHANFGLNVPELTQPAPGVNATKAVNVHSIALQVPKGLLTANGSAPTDASKTSAVIGVWTTASRRKVKLSGRHGHDQGDDNGDGVGPFTQISRMGNPLFNEVLVPMERKDYWNTEPPSEDSQFLSGVQHPELANLLPVLYPNVFPHLAALNKSGKVRADLVAILLTGIPGGVVPGFPGNSGGSTVADLLRLNMAIPPTTVKPSNIGLIGGDAAGFPNGRRVFDDVFTIELRAIAGATFGLVDKTFSPDAPATAVSDGLTTDPLDQAAEGTVKYLKAFPYLGTPHSGFKVPALADAST